jgi:hypothetical protein
MKMRQKHTHLGTGLAVRITSTGVLGYKIVFWDRNYLLFQTVREWRYEHLHACRISPSVHDH